MATKKGKTVVRAAAKAIPGTQVANTIGKAVTTGGWREMAKQSIAESRKATSMLPQASANVLSFKNGIMTLGGNRLESPLPIVLLAHGYERDYFSKPYQDGVLAIPDCYSFDKIAPHEKSPVPQNDLCETCHWNQWGSDNRQKGKACKEGARLVFMHANHTKSDSAVMAAPLVIARLSVNNSKPFRAYVENVFDAEDRPTWTVQTMLYCEPDQGGNQYAVNFVPTALGADEDILDAIASRLDEAKKLTVQPYPEIAQPATPVQAASRARRKF